MAKIQFLKPQAALRTAASASLSLGDKKHVRQQVAAPGSPALAAAPHETEHLAENSRAAVPGPLGPRWAPNPARAGADPPPVARPSSPGVRYLLGLRQPQPEQSPGPEFVPVAKHVAHLRAGVA